MEIWKAIDEKWDKKPFLPFPLQNDQNLRDVLIAQSQRNPEAHVVMFSNDEATLLVEWAKNSLKGFLPEIDGPVMFFLKNVVCKEKIEGKTLTARPSIFDQEVPTIPMPHSIHRLGIVLNEPPL